MTAATFTLTLSGISAGYGEHRVLRGLDAGPWPAGTVTALVGPNGAGKTTLLRALAGLHPARGTAHLGAEDLFALPFATRAGRVTFMPQTLPQQVGLTVLEGVVSALRASPVDGAPVRDAPARAYRILERIGIGDRAMTPLDHLSGGERQMAGLAQALAREPRLLLLDEPTSALDLGHQVAVMTLVRSLAAEGRVVVVVLHDLNLAVRWADQIAVLHRGMVQAAGVPAQAITTGLLADVYGVNARIETCSAGRLQVLVDGIVPAVAAMA